MIAKRRTTIIGRKEASILGELVKAAVKGEAKAVDVKAAVLLAILLSQGLFAIQGLANFLSRICLIDQREVSSGGDAKGRLIAGGRLIIEK